MGNYLSDLISRAIFMEIIAYDRSPYHELNKKLYDIDSYFKNIPTDTEKLPRNLNLELRDRVVNDFKAQIEFYFGQSTAAHLFNTIKQTVQTKCPDAERWAIADACDRAKQEVRDNVTQLFNYEPTEQEKPFYQHDKHYAKISESELRQRYENAKQRTLAERFSKINKTDVMVFHRALVNKTFWDCRQLFKEKIIGLVETVLDEIKKENT